MNTYLNIIKIKESTLRAKAVKTGVSDSSTLIKIYENDKNWHVKMQALVKIKDKEYLKKVALDSKNDHTFRKEAIDRIKDNIYLGEVALKETNDDLREYTVSKILSKKLLEELKKKFIKNKLIDASLYALIKKRITELPNSISFMFDED